MPCNYHSEWNTAQTVGFIVLFKFAFHRLAVVFFKSLNVFFAPNVATASQARFATSLPANFPVPRRIALTPNTARFYTLDTSAPSAVNSSPRSEDA